MSRLIYPLPPVDARCLTLGLTIILQGHEEAMGGAAQWNQGSRFCIGKRAEFARRIRFGPWDRVVRRREAAKAREIFHLETMFLFFGNGDSRYAQEIMYLQGEI